MYLIPQGPNANNLSTSFTTLLAQDGITLAVTNKYGKGLASRRRQILLLALDLPIKSVPSWLRGEGRLFYNGFENRGFSPNLGENYPFQFNFQFAPANDNTPITYPGCTSPSATPLEAPPSRRDSPVLH